METPSQSQQQYEGAILTQLVKNAERLAVVEQEIKSVRQEITSVKSELDDIRKIAERSEWWLRLIGGAILVSLFKEQLFTLIAGR